MSDVTGRLQAWYATQCDGAWEHERGIRIDTLDNPGWSVRIDLRGTSLAEKSFEPISIERTECDWLRCDVKNGAFEGYGGTGNLAEVLEAFLYWAGV